MTKKRGQSSGQVEKRDPNPQKQGSTVIRTEYSAEHFRGPLPPPETFGSYDKVLPGAAERILRMAEKQQEHRHSMEMRIVRGEIGAEYLGQLFAFLLGVTGMGGGIYLMAIGVSGFGIAAFLAALATLAGAFIITKKNDAALQKESLQDQQEGNAMKPQEKIEQPQLPFQDS